MTPAARARAFPTDLVADQTPPVANRGRRVRSCCVPGAASPTALALTSGLIATIAITAAHAEPTTVDGRTAPELPSVRRARTAAVALRYRHATDLDGGLLELTIRRPLASRWWAEAAAGLQLGALDGRRAITLTNPRLEVGLVLGPRLVATVGLGLPAASATGDDGRFAAAHAALAVVDPAVIGPATTSMVAAISPRWLAGKAFAQGRFGGTVLIPDGGGARLLLHADVGGGIAVAGPVGLAATLSTTSYLLAGVAGDDFVHRLTLAAQVAWPAVEWDLGVAAPLDRRERTRGLFELVAVARARF